MFGFENFTAGLNFSWAEVTLIHEPGAKRGSCIYGTIVKGEGGGGWIIRYDQKGAVKGLHQIWSPRLWKIKKNIHFPLHAFKTP